MKKWWSRQVERADDLLIQVLGKLHIPGFRGVTLYPMLRLLKQDMTNRAFVLNSSAMAYAFFLSIFPTIIFVFSLLPYVPSAGLEGGVEDTLQRILPEQAFELVRGAFDRTVSQGNPWRLLLSLVVVLFLGIRGVTAMANAFNTMDPLHKKDRNLIKQTLVGIYLYLIILVLAGAATVVWIWGQSFILPAKAAGHSSYWAYVIVFRLAMLFVLLLALNFIYRVAPTYPYRWKTFSPGSVVASVLLLVAILLLNVYFSQFSNYNKIYGSLGAVIVMLVWFYWLSFVLQIGFHLNSNIQELVVEQQLLKQKRKLIKRNMEEDQTNIDEGTGSAAIARGDYFVRGDGNNQKLVYFCSLDPQGKMAEWPNATVLKTVVPQGTGD